MWHFVDGQTLSRVLFRKLVWEDMEVGKMPDDYRIYCCFQLAPRFVGAKVSKHCGQTTVMRPIAEAFPIVLG